MSHVDEGTLHAFLDGELTPVERERVDTHVKGCPACQARLAEERALIERAGRLLGMATPPERTMPPLSQLRQRRARWWQVRRPLALVATLILAVGLGWFAHGHMQQVEEHPAAYSMPAEGRAALARPATSSPGPDSVRFFTPPQGHLAMRQAGRPADSALKDRDALQHEQESTQVATGAAAANAVASLGVQKVDAAAQLPHAAPPAVKVRGNSAPAAAAEQQAAAPAPSPTLGADAANGVISWRTRRAPVLTSTTWPIITRQPARDALGVEPVIIPGFAVRAYRRNPATQEIAVEQVTDAGTTISLIERRVEGRLDSAANIPQTAAKAVNERLARFVGSLRIEIEGPLTPDSLSSLLELAR